MLQRPFVVIEAEEKRADGVFPALVPAESGNHAVRGAGVLDLEHRPLARLIGASRRLRNHTIESRAFETLQPVHCQLAIAGHRREVERATPGREQFLELVAPLLLWRVHPKLAPDGVGAQGDAAGRVAARGAALPGPRRAGG